jgi:nucleotide-binding universal stress UspA family protein
MAAQSRHIPPGHDLDQGAPCDPLRFYDDRSRMGEQFMFKRIVLAYDGSEHAKRAFDVAVELAVKFGASLDIVQVVTHSHVDNPDGIELAKCAASSLAPVVTRAKTKGVKSVNPEVLRGDAADETLSYATSSGADLIVLGRRGLSRVGGLVLGSVSAKIAGQAECAVLTVK